MLRSPDSCNSTLLKVPVNMIMSHSNNIFVEPFIALNIDAVNLSIQHEGSMFARVQRQNGQTQKIVGPLWPILVTVC